MDAQQTALLDITVLVDAIVNEQQADNASKDLLDLATSGQIKGYVCATALEALGDFLTRDLGPDVARASLQRICATLSIVPVDAGVIDGAMSLGWRYLDDALTFECARRMGLDNLVTLNGPDFDNASLRIRAPEEFLRAIRQGH
jgi:predicted nucleic acid-binding protein